MKAAINGGRTRSEHPGVPLTLDEIVGEARRVIDAGADIVHTHTFDDAGRQSIAAGPIAAAVERFNADIPGISVGTTVGLWTCDGHRDRLRAIESWTLVPEFVAVAYSEEGADEAVRLLVDRGIPVETAVWSLDDVPALLDSAVLDRHIRVLVEPETQDPDEAVRVCRTAAEQLRAGGVTAPLLYHGDGATVWPVLRAALADGVQARIGFEDGITLPDGTVAAGNADLVAAAVAEERQLTNSRTR
ncbi:MAG: 3-keto-5-aminohexanoate cleavage protein [Gordonia sp. (in: high G+C Gram-positive bacteria)]